MPDLTGRGTPEHHWRAWPGLPPAHALARRPSRAVLVAPHPDDEVLGAGGTLASWAAAGTQVTLLCLTDGENSHPDSTTITPTRMAQRRRDESTRAWTLLGLGDCQVVRLGLPDGSVADNRTQVAAAVGDLCTAQTLCMAPWPGDGHPDHDAAGDASLDAARAAGAPCVTYPVWMWHWATPGDPRVPWHRARSSPLTPALAAAKQRAAAGFMSQTRPHSPAPADQPVLPAYVLHRLLRDYEVFFT